MIRIRRGEERGRTHLGWLDSRHTFSFANFRDPAFMSQTEPVHFLQVWVVPERDDLVPGYEQRSVHGAFRLVGSRDGRDGSVTVHQDVDVYAGTPAPEFVHELRAGRHAWIHVATGEVTVNDRRLGEGDGAALTDEPRLLLHADGPARVMLIDLDQACCAANPESLQSLSG